MQLDCIKYMFWNWKLRFTVTKSKARYKGKSPKYGALWGAQKQQSIFSYVSICYEKESSDTHATMPMAFWLLNSLQVLWRLRNFTARKLEVLWEAYELKLLPVTWICSVDKHKITMKRQKLHSLLVIVTDVV